MSNRSLFNRHDRALDEMLRHMMPRTPKGEDKPLTARAPREAKPLTATIKERMQ